MPRSNKKEVHLVTGGGGYPGYNLGMKLADLGHTVILFDIREPTWPLVNGMKFCKGSIVNRDEVESIFEEVDCVYHMASYGMSGRAMLKKKLIEAVNIVGTENVIQGCMMKNVGRLVYTSTYNVIFGTEEIVNGDESLPYLASHKYRDHYSRTKSLAEQSILAVNGLQMANGHILHTCSLRLAGVYGPGEMRHLPRIMSNIEKGLFVVTYGGDTLQDFLHIDNLVQAHIKAGEALQTNGHLAAGQTYFVSDDQPINTFQFFNKLASELGYPEAKFSLPMKLIYFLAFLTELVHFGISSVYNFQPILTRSEVCKTGITHYFSIKKAHDELGYSPTVQNDLTEVIQYYKMTGHMCQVKQTSLKYYLVNFIIAFIVASLLLSFLPIAR